MEGYVGFIQVATREQPHSYVFVSNRAGCANLRSELSIEHVDNPKYCFTSLRVLRTYHLFRHMSVHALNYAKS